MVEPFRFRVGRPRKREVREHYLIRMLVREREAQEIAAGLEGFSSWSAWVRHVLEKATAEAMAKAPSGALLESEERVSW